MAIRLGSWIAIVLGGTGGAAAALAGSANVPLPTPAVSAPPLGPLAAIAASAQASAVAARATAAPAPAGPALTAIVTASPSAVPAAPTAALAAPATSADTAPLPTTQEALLRAEVRCDQGKSESCIIAARSYEAGSAGATDPEKAAKYRRIAITMWISHCDKNSVDACVTLSKLYRAGEGVAKSDRNADALIERARALCKYNDTPACQGPPGAMTP
jgi:TPR repeat protein